MEGLDEKGNRVIISSSKLTIGGLTIISEILEKNTKVEELKGLVEEKTEEIEVQEPPESNQPIKSQKKKRKKKTCWTRYGQTIVLVDYTKNKL